MKFTKRGVRYWFDTFKNLKSFDILDYQDVIDLYLKNQSLLQKNNYEKLGGDNERPINSDVEKVDKDGFWLGYSPVYFNIDPYGKKITQAKADVVSMDMQGHGKFWDNFIYLELPADLFKQYQISVHSNPDISIFKKFTKELDKTDFSKVEALKLIDKYDKAYSDKKNSYKNFFDTKTDLAWKSDLEIGQYWTIKQKGLIYPICFNHKNYILKRGSHRALFCALSDSDVPVFIQTPKPDWDGETLNEKNWDVMIECNFENEVIMNVDVNERKLTFTMDNKILGVF